MDRLILPEDKRIFVTSDPHFNHDKDFIVSARRFKNVNEMNAAIIRNWNRVVNPDDFVIVLGDLILGDNSTGMSLVQQLNGDIALIIGNHDTDERIKFYQSCHKIKYIGFGDRIRYKGVSFYLSHYPAIPLDREFLDPKNRPLKRTTVNLCGHVHTTDKWKDWDKGMIYHCELDAHNMMPVSLLTVIDDITKKYK